MKIIYHDKNRWNLPNFEKLEGWAKLILIYMWDNADCIGFFDWNAVIAKEKLKLDIPSDTSEIKEALEGFATMVDDNLFLLHDYITTTQYRQKLTPDNPFHVQLFAAMEDRFLQGVKNVTTLIVEHNVKLIVVSLEKCKAGLRLAENKYDKVTKQNQNAFEASMQIFWRMGLLGDEARKELNQKILPLNKPENILLSVSNDETNETEEAQEEEITANF
jgi:hypothetical protein